MSLIRAPRTTYCVGGGATHGRRLGQIDATAALESKAVLGLAIPIKPLPDNATIDKGSGVALGLVF